MTFHYANTKILTITTADELRDSLAGSGIFDMLDCEVELICPPNAQTSEIEKMVRTIESMINVVDVRVSGVPRYESDTAYTVSISNVPIEVAKGKTRG